MVSLVLATSQMPIKERVASMKRRTRDLKSRLRSLSHPEPERTGWKGLADQVETLVLEDIARVEEVFRGLVADDTDVMEDDMLVLK